MTEGQPEDKCPSIQAGACSARSLQVQRESLLWTMDKSTVASKGILLALVVVGVFNGDKGVEGKGVWIPRGKINISGGYGYRGSGFMNSFSAMQEDPQSIYRKYHRRGGVFDEPIGKVGKWSHDKPVRPSDYQNDHHDLSPEIHSEEMKVEVTTTTTTTTMKPKSRKRPEVPAPIAFNLLEHPGDSDTMMETTTETTTSTTTPFPISGSNGRVYRKSCGMRCGLG